MTSGCSPGWRAVALAEVILNLVGEAGDQLGSLCQVVAPDGIGMERDGMPGSQGSGPGSVGVSAGRRQ